MNTFSNRRWLVLPVTEVENINFDQILESSPETLRYSVDGNKVIIKYEVNIITEESSFTYVDAETGEDKVSTISPGIYGRPSIYEEGMIEYNHEEILALLATEEWTSPLSDIQGVV